MWISWVASGLTLLGNAILIKYKTWFTFVIFLVANVLFTYYWAVRKEYPTLILTSVFVLMNIWGMIAWRKEKKHGKVS